MTRFTGCRPSPNNSLSLLYQPRAQGHPGWLFYFPFFSVSELRLLVSFLPPPLLLRLQLCVTSRECVSAEDLCLWCLTLPFSVHSDQAGFRRKAHGRL